MSKGCINCYNRAVCRKAKSIARQKEIGSITEEEYYDFIFEQGCDNWEDDTLDYDD